MFIKFKTFSALMLSICVLSAEMAEELEPTVVASEVDTISDSAPHVINLKFIFERIRSYNPRVLFEKEAVQRALQRSYQTRAAYLPQVSLFASQTRQQLGRGFGGNPLLNNPPFNSFTAGVEARQTLLDTQVYSEFRIAKLQSLIAESNYDVAIQDILEQAVQTYFTVLRDMQRVVIVEGNIVREQELLDLATNQFKNGVATKIDVTRAEVRVASQKRSLMVAETALEDSSLQLRALLDLDLDSEWTVDRRIIERVKAPPEVSRYASMGDLLEERPELYSQRKQLEQAKLAEFAADWQRLPKLDVFARWGIDSDEAFDGDEEEAWLVGIEASLPLFAGGSIRARKLEAEAAVRQFEHLLHELRVSLQREFKFTLTDMQSRYAQISIASEEIRLGFDEVALAKERYREGFADNRELIDAQQNLANAELSHLNAIYLYGLSRLAFARSIGSVERITD